MSNATIFTFNSNRSTVRTKAQTLTAMMESPEKMELEKSKYNKIRAQMGRPGIVDMNGGDTPRDFRKTSRMTLDIQTGDGRRSLSGNSLSSPVNSTPSGSLGGLTSPRRSLENKRQVAPRAPSLSLDGRYSLSIPLQSIEE